MYEWKVRIERASAKKANNALGGLLRNGKEERAQHFWPN